MSTRGYLGIKKKGELKGQYNHFDSYVVGGLGEHLCKIIEDLPKKDRVNILSETFDFIELIDENSTPTTEQIDYCLKQGVADLSVSEQSVSDWYCLLRNVQGDIKNYIDKKCKYMLNGNSFLEDKIWCEYGYVINLDNKTLEIYTLGALNSEYDLETISAEKVVEDFKYEY